MFTQEAITNSVYTLYLLDVRGLAPAVLGWLHAASDVFVLVADVPLGYVADRCGRRASLIAGALAQGLGVLAMWRAASVPGLLAGYLLIALGDAFRSGADQALLYDTCRALDEVHAYRQRYAMMAAAALSALAVGEVAGGTLAHRVSFDAAWAAEALMSAIAVVIALELVEAPRANEPEVTAGEERGSAGEVIALAAGLVALGALPALAGFLAAFELRARGAGTTEALGLLLSVRHLTQAAAGWIAGRGWIPANLRAVGALGAASLAGLLALAALPAGAGVTAYAVLLLLASLPRGLTAPLASALVNRRLSGRWRATALSAMGMGERLLVIPLIPLLATLSGRGAFRTAYLVLAGLLLAALSLLISKGGGGTFDIKRERGQ